jgi:hypothetical protein
MAASISDEDRFAVGEEDERAGDLTDLDAECVGGLLRGAGAVVEPPDLAAGPEECEPLAYADD